MKKTIVVLMLSTVLYYGCTKEKAADVKQPATQSVNNSQATATTSFSIVDTSTNKSSQLIKKKVVKIKYPKPKVQ